MIYRALLVVLVSLFAAPTLLAQDDELKLEAVKDFKTFWRKNRETASRVEAVMTLKGNECIPAAMELVRLLDNPEEDIRRAAMAVIETFNSVNTFQSFIDELPEMKEQVRRALLIDVLSRAGIRQALPVLREIALHDKKADVNVRTKIAEAIGRMKDATDSIPVLSKFLDDPEPSVKITAVATVGDLRIQALGDKLVPLLADRYWQVQSAAIEAVGKVRVAAAIDPLVALMRKAGRFKTDTAEALFLITSKDYGAHPDVWVKRLKALRSFGWKMPSDADVAKAKATRKRNDEFYGRSGGSKKTFAKITTTSTRVLFIIDISGSMEDHIVEKAKFDAGYEDYQKLTIVKSELINTIDSLDRHTKFNIVAFATKLKPWKKGLVPANIVSKSAAKSFVKRLRPLGGSEAAEMASVGLSSTLAAGRTNTFKALMYPFNINPDKAQKTVFTGGLSREFKKNKLDTVFFLSDGKPSIGKYVDTEEILREVQQINKVYRIVIHAIAIGQFQKEFLRSLAMQNGGEFVDLGY
jgi:HEAT repeat protein